MKNLNEPMLKLEKQQDIPMPALVLSLSKDTSAGGGLTKKRVSIKVVSGLLLAGMSMQSCGKHEATGGTVGAVSGAIIGTAVAGKRDKGTGALLGGLIGSFIGREALKGADEDVREERYQRKVAEHTADRLRERPVQQVTRVVVCEADRWCPHCSRRNNIIGARRCTDCGSSLIQEKFCRGCSVSFAPNSAYRYCPYCVDRQYLVMR